MITFSPKHHVFLAIKAIDFPKGIRGIAKLCQAQYQLNPMSGHYFVISVKQILRSYTTILRAFA